MGLGSQVVLPARSHGGQDRRIRWIDGRSRRLTSSLWHANPLGNKKKTNFGCWMTLSKLWINSLSIQHTWHIWWLWLLYSVYDILFYSAMGNCWARKATKLSSSYVIHMDFQENTYLAKPDRPSEHLLRWHYRQSSFDKYERRRGAHTGIWLPSRFWYDFPDP